MQAVGETALSETNLASKLSEYGLQPVMALICQKPIQRNREGRDSGGAAGV